MAAPAWRQGIAGFEANANNNSGAQDAGPPQVAARPQVAAEPTIADVKAMPPNGFQKQIMARIEAGYQDRPTTRRKNARQFNILTLKSLVSSKRPVLEIAKATAMLELLESQEQEKISLEEPKIESNPCSQLYDPCSRMPLFGNQIEILEQRLKFIKQQAAIDVSKFPEFPDSIDNRLKLLVHLIQLDAPPTYSIFQYKKGGNENFGTSLFEAYWDIALALGVIDEHKLSIKGRYMVNAKVEALKGTLNFSDKTKFIPNEYILKEYLGKRKVMATNEQGASDITVAYEKEYIAPPEESCLHRAGDEKPSNRSERPVFYLFSSKFFKKEKSVNNYDVERIYLAAKHLKEMGVDIKIPILANDKTRLDGFKARALNRFVAEEIHETYGATELLHALNAIYTRIEKRYPKSKDRTVDAIAEVFGLTAKTTPLDFFRPRFHQIIAIDKICGAIKATKAKGFTAENNKYLVGVLPRGGKTFIAGGIVEALQPKIVLVILGAKSETIKQFTDDLFEKFQNFSNYTVVNLLDKSQDITPGNMYIIISSIELLVKESTDGSRKIMEKILSNEPGYRADLILYDEAHLKGTKGRGRAALDAVEKKKRKQTGSDDEDEEVTDALAEKEEQVLEQIDTCPIIFFTGTYRKPRDRFKIPENRMIVWDYEDIQRGKSLITEMDYFKERFGDYVEKALEQLQRGGTTVEDIEVSYQKFPELYLLTANFNEEAKKELNPEVLDFPNLFAINKEFNFKTAHHNTWHTALEHNDKLENLLAYFSPNRQQAKYKSVIDRIDELAQMSHDRLRGIASSPDPGKQKTHSQIWFMPRTTGLGTLPNRMMAFASLIMKQEWLGTYFDIVCVYTKGKGEQAKKAPVEFTQYGGRVIFQPWTCTGKQTLKECLIHYEAISRKNGRCLIILAQDKLKLGISLPCVDVVVLLDDNKDVDERIQKMYRVLTESDDKKAGFVVDMNYFRCVNAVIEYHILKDRTKRRQNLRGTDLDKTVQTVFRGLLAFDPDKFLELAVEKGSEMAETQIKDELRALVAGASQYSDIRDKDHIDDIGKRLNAEVEAIVDDIDMDEDMVAALKLTKEERERELKRKLRGPGSHVKKAQRHQVGPQPEPEPKEDESEKIRRAKQDIYKTILKFGAITGNISDIETYLKHLQLTSSRQSRLDLYELLVQRDTLEENADDKKQDAIMKLYIDSFRKKITDDSRGLFKTMKERVNSFDASDNFAEILEYITAHLAPKDKERHKYGEVFTPLALVDEMLSTMPADVWSDKNLKWLDPANGIGNFPIKAFIGQKSGQHTYPGLYEGLKTAIPDEQTRCKHIIEKMLYMIDINNKNNVIAKRLFNKLCPDAIPNIEQIHRTQGFLADVDLKFANGIVNQFDIIMGNPPYNGGTILRKHTLKVRAYIKEQGLEGTKRESLWTQFVLKIFKKNILKKDGYLLFITPINWFHPEVSGVRDIFLSKQIDVIRIIFLEQSKKLFGGSGELTTAHYLIQNKAVSRPTTIIDMLNNKETVRLHKDSIIILAYNSIYAKICDKSTLFMKTDSIKSTAVKKCESGPNKQIIGIYESGDIKFVKTSEKHQLAHIPKIVINGYTYPRYYYDRAGEYGKFSKDGTNFVIVGDDLDKVKSYFDTKLSALLLNYIKFTQKKIDPKYYPDVRTLPLAKITDETLADYFGFTKEEREAINVTEYPKREYKFKEVTCTDLKGPKAEPKEESDDESVEGGSYQNQKRRTRKIRR